MAIGIPLSSLDVVVGISGVHYVLQGLRQIDRELDATSQRRVVAALDLPDMGAQVRGIQGAAGLGVSGIRQITGALMDLQRVATAPTLNQGMVAQARQTIALAQQAGAAATQMNAAARAGAMEATAAERAYNVALRERAVLQTQATRAAAAVAATTQQATQLAARDYYNFITTRTGQGIRALNNTYSQDPRVVANAHTYIDTTVEALENRRVDRMLELQQRHALQLTERNRLTAQLGALPPIGPLQATATAARANAATLQAAAVAATNHAAGLQGAAGAARQYIQQTAGLLARGQQVQAILAAVGRLGAGVLQGIMALGRFGVAAGGAALEVGRFVVGVLRIPAIAGTLTGGLSLIAENFRAIATSVGLVIATVAGLSFKEIISEGMDFEEALSNVRAVAQYTVRPDQGQVTAAGGNAQVASAQALADQMERLDYITLKLGADTIFSNTEIANIIETLLRGGVDVASVTEATALAAANLASATKSSTETAASVIAGTIKMFGATADQIPHYADIISGAVNTTNMSLDDFASAIRQLGPLAQALGIPFEDVTTLLAQLATKNYMGEIAGTSLRNMLLYLTPRTKPAIQELQSAGLWVGSTEPTRVVSEEDQENYQIRLNNYKVQMDNYYKAIADYNAGKRKTQPTMPIQPTAPKGTEVAGETGHSAFFNPDGSLKNIPEIINLLQGATKGMSDEDLAQFSDKVFGKRSGAASLLLTKEDADQFQKTKELISSITASQVAAFRLENLKGKIELLSGSLKSLAAVFYMNWLSAPLLGAFTRLIPIANSALDWFGKKGQDGMSMAQKFFGSLGKGLQTGNLGAAWVDMMGAAPGLSGNEWSNRIRVIMRWLQLGRDAIITFGEAWSGTWRGAATQGINPIIRAIGVLATWWGTLWRSIKQLLGGEIGIRQFAANIIGGLDRLWQEVVGWTQVTWPGIKDLLQRGWASITGFGAFVWDTLLKPELGILWGRVSSQDNRDMLGAKVRELFQLGKGFLSDAVLPWLDGIGASIEGWFAKKENQQVLVAGAQQIGGSIGTAIADAIGLGVSAPIIVALQIKASNTFEVASAAVVEFIAAMIASFSLEMTKSEDQLYGAAFGSLGSAIINAGGDGGTAGGVATKNGLVSALDDLSAVLLVQMIKATLWLPLFFAKVAEVAGLAFINAFSFVVNQGLIGLTVLVNGIIDRMNEPFKNIPGVKLIQHVDFSGQGIPQAELDKLNAKVLEDLRGGIYPKWLEDLQQQLSDFLNPKADIGARSGKRNAAGYSDVFDPTTGKYTDERRAAPMRVNPITGTQAPTGTLWVFDPEKRAWVLVPEVRLVTPQRNPDTGQVAAAGYKWVWDAATMAYVLYPVADTTVGSGVVNARASAPDGMVWVWDPIAKAYALVWAGAGPPTAPPYGGLGSGLGTGATSTPTNENIPGGGEPPPVRTVPRSGGPVNLTVQIIGTTDDVYMRRLNETLDGLVAKYNGAVTA